MKRAIAEVITALFIILWIYTGLNKMLDAKTFVSQLGRSPFIQPLAGFIAIALPYGELLLAVLLICKRSRELALYLSYGLMLLFTGYVYLMLNYAYDLPCSCGGIVSKLSWIEHLWFNIGFTLLAVFAILIESNVLFILKRKEVMTLKS